MRNVETYYRVVTLLYILVQYFRGYNGTVFDIGQATVWTMQVLDHTKDKRPLCSKIFIRALGVYPTSYIPGTVGSFWRVEQLGRDVDHSQPSGGEVKNE
jgi:hypothetical protein